MKGGAQEGFGKQTTQENGQVRVKYGVPQKPWVLERSFLGVSNLPFHSGHLWKKHPWQKTWQKW